MNRKSFQKDTKIILYVVICLVIVIIGSSYALFFEVKKNDNNQVVRAGSLKFTYVNGNEITSSNKVTCFEPMNDERAESLTSCVYSLSVQNTGSLVSNYSLSITTNNSNSLETSKMKVILKRVNQGASEIVSGYPAILSDLTNGTLISETISPNTTIVYEVQVYIPESLVSEADNNKVISLNINGTGEVTDNQYTVTFDPDGGTLSTLTKEVVYGEEYGELPVPTKEGYTFKGWNGKNMFNYEEILKNNFDLRLDELNGRQTISWINGSNTNNHYFMQGQFKNNTQYTFSGNVASNTENRLVLKIKYTNESIDKYIIIANENYKYPQKNIFVNHVFTSSYNKTVDFFGGAWSAGERMYIDINSFQIEEGTEATPYEPYFITSDTKVVQEKNHTLTAIWEQQ